MHRRAAVGRNKAGPLNGLIASPRVAAEKWSSGPRRRRRDWRTRSEGAGPAVNRRPSNSVRARPQRGRQQIGPRSAAHLHPHAHHAATPPTPLAPPLARVPPASPRAHKHKGPATSRHVSLFTPGLYSAYSL